MDLALDWALCGVDMFIEEATPASHSSSTWGRPRVPSTTTLAALPGSFGGLIWGD